MNDVTKSKKIWVINIYFMCMIMMATINAQLYASEPQILYTKNKAVFELTIQISTKTKNSIRVEKSQKQKFAKKNQHKKTHRIRKSHNWWSLLDLFFQSPGGFLLGLIALVLSFGFWLLFMALGTTLAFEVALILGVVVTLIGYIVFSFM